MTNRDIFLLVLLVAGTVLMWFVYQFSNGHYGSFEKPSAPAAQTPGQRTTAPDFTLAGLDGSTHRLSDFRGNVVALIFWTTW